ncbi:MAG TPA: SMC family ATPase [Verrucomicrobiota bacterium]|nr:SMC family ATPase [Verrucomicrobiota bacterium]
MRLLRLELKNWCQHSELDVVFPNEPLIHLSGPNNGGKSNLVRAIGRAVAQGRSDFGDASDIQFGAKQASIRLTALTHERVQFTLSRTIKERQSKAALEFENKVLTSAEEIQQQLQEWFGRQETLLELLIAPQGQIASLIRERGRDRLTKFIEICGFKGFLQKQAALNKFQRSYPTINDPGPLILDVESKLGQAEQQAAEKNGALHAHPDRSTLQAELAGLQQTKTLRESTESQLAAKREALAKAQAKTGKELPNLEELQNRIRNVRGVLAQCHLASRYQKAQKTHHELQRVEKELAALPEDSINHGQQLQETSDALQTMLKRRSEIATAHTALEQLRKELGSLDRIIAQNQKTVANLRHSRNWYRLSLDQILQLQTASQQQQGLEQALNRLKEKLGRLEKVPRPSAETLKACQASEAKLQEITSLHRHAASATDTCPLCQRAWETTALGRRRSELDAQTKELQHDLTRSQQAAAEYRDWTQAQAEIPKLHEQILREESNCAEKRRELAAQMGAFELPEAEIAQVGAVIAGYQKVREAMNPPVQEAEALRQRIAAEATADQQRVLEDDRVARDVEKANLRIRELLQQQTEAGNRATKRARLKQQTETLQSQLAGIQSDLGAEPPGYKQEADYQELCQAQERELTEAQEAFQKASRDWTERFDQLRSAEALKAEIASAEQRIRALTWGKDQEERVAQLQQTIAQVQQLNSEINLLQQQADKLRGQMKELAREKERFDQQGRNLADMQAVSAFLSYDNGPQKFLTSFFEEVLTQTNLLLSEMGLPIKLHMGTDLEIMVEDRNAQESSALALGGGYANLVGIAFRIALQRMILPRVHVLILDEPSTHIDETNMELLIPFFQKLKENLNHYGIEQCLIIDHHPNWRNTTAAVINVGANGFNRKAEETAVPEESPVVQAKPTDP